MVGDQVPDRRLRRGAGNGRRCHEDSPKTNTGGLQYVDRRSRASDSETEGGEEPGMAVTYKGGLQYVLIGDQEPDGETAD